MSGESALSKRIGLALSRLPGLRLFRNQVGRYKLADGRWLASGLKVGSGDRIGWRSRIVTLDMIGQRIAQFVSIEVKGDDGVEDDDQIAWAQTVRDAGGLAGFAYSEKDALDIVDGRA